MIPVPNVRSRNVSLIAAVLILGLVVGAAIPLFTGGTTTFLVPQGWRFDAALQPMAAGTVAVPDGVTIERPATFRISYERLLAGDADGGIIPAVLLPALLAERPDMEVLPVAGTAPGEKAGIYVPRDSPVQEPCDLVNRSVVLPRATCSPIYMDNLITQYALRQTCGPAAAIDFVPEANATGEESARLYLGYPPEALDQRRVFSPLDAVEPRLLYVVDQDVTAATADRIVAAMNRSGRTALADINATMDAVGTDPSVRPLLRSQARLGTFLVPLDPQRVSRLQDYLDYATSEHLSSGRVELARHIRHG